MMTILFALANDGSCGHLAFPLLHAIHDVNTTTESFKPFAATFLCLRHALPFVIQSSVAMASRCLWDPGIRSTVCRANTTMAIASRRWSAVSSIMMTCTELDPMFDPLHTMSPPAAPSIATDMCPRPLTARRILLSMTQLISNNIHDTVDNPRASIASTIPMKAWLPLSPTTVHLVHYWAPCTATGQWLLHSGSTALIRSYPILWCPMLTLNTQAAQHATTVMVPSVTIKMMCIPLSKRVATMPSLWCLLLLLPVCFLVSHQVSSVAFHQTAVHNNRWMQPLIHPPWHDCLYLRACCYLIHTFHPSLWSWDVTNPRLFRLWHNLIGYWLVVMLLGSSQRSSLARQLVTPPIFQPVHLVHNLL